ncbi:MAG: tetratricopeptide repeat-containing sulfotransferase family protein [Aeoliella sp.]
MSQIRKPLDAAVVQARRDFAEGEFDLAAKKYEQALSARPRDAALMLELAQTYALKHRRCEATDLLKSAVQAAPQQPEIQGVAGQLFERMRMHDEACECFEQARRANPRSIAALNCLAQAAERSHRLEEARGYVDQALALNRNDPQARLTQAILDRREGAWERADARLRDLVARRPPSPISWQARYQRAHVLDRMAEYDAAMQELIAAKAFLQSDGKRWRERANVLKAKLRQTSEALIPAYTLDWQETPSPDSSRRFAVLAGHPRSGTTLLEQALDAHPDVTSAEELPLLAELVHDPMMRQHDPASSVPDILDRLSPDELAGYRQTYFESIDAALPTPVGNRLLVDKNPEALRLTPTIGRVFPEAKMIVAIRDPRDVCLSCFMQPLPLNSVSVSFLDLESTVDRYAAVMGFWHRVRKTINVGWMEVRYEDVVRDLAPQTRRVAEFLDVPWDKKMTQTKEHAKSRYVHSPSYEAVTSSVHAESVGRWNNYAKYFGPLVERLEALLTELKYV